MAHATRRARGPASVSAAWASVQLFAGALLLAVAALAGLLFARRPGPDRIDAAGDFYLPQDSGSHLANELVKLGSLPVLLGGIAVIFLASVVRDFVRAIICAATPGIAVLVVERVAKPMVGRVIDGGGYTYPSGTVTAVAALAAALFLVTPLFLRPLTAILGGGAIAAVGVAVIVLRWHYATDVVGGVCVGVGAVFFLDALAHLPFIAYRASQPAGANLETPSRSPMARAR